mmetsp:Transcript_18786/g.72455  ORF Transcript_18786/g.72455 Transcript_18786/m.72455 type:complete len:219 (-) Transcript_18786:988-1644(-)
MLVSVILFLRQLCLALLRHHLASLLVLLLLLTLSLLCSLLSLILHMFRQVCCEDVHLCRRSFLIMELTAVVLMRRDELLHVMLTLHRLLLLLVNHRTLLPILPMLLSIRILLVTLTALLMLILRESCHELLRSSEVCNVHEHLQLEVVDHCAERLARLAHCLLPPEALHKALVENHIDHPLQHEIPVARAGQRIELLVRLLHAVLHALSRPREDRICL